MSGTVVVNQPGVYLVDEDGNLISLADGDAIGSAEGLILMGKDGANARMIAVDASGNLAALPLPTGAATEATLAAIDAVLDAIKDTDGIKKITDALPAGTNEIGAVKQGTKATGMDAWPVYLADSVDGDPVTVSHDAGVDRLEIRGKVQTVGAIPPPETNEARINADTPLTVGTHDTLFTIPNGETFHLQAVTAGNEDPTKGAVIEVIYDNGSEHVIERVYTAGFTGQIGFPDISEARDGTPLDGNGVHTIIVRRTKYAGSDIAIDAEVRGYTV